MASTLLVEHLCRARRRLVLSSAAAGLAATLLVATPVAGAEIEGFTAPYREIDAAAAAAGVIQSVEVQEGDQVHEGQVLAHLNREVLSATLEIAARLKEARGELKSARAELFLRTDRLEKLKMLLVDDHASEEEVIRASAAKQIAEARLLSAEEALQVRQVEFQRTQAQLEERTIRAAIDGVITRILKDEGEFVSPADPVILTIVQLDPLLATFSVPASLAESLTKDQAVQLRPVSSDTMVTGTVEFVSPVVNAQSGTIVVKVRFANPDGKYRSGEKCMLLLMPQGHVNKP